MLARSSSLQSEAIRAILNCPMLAPCNATRPRPLPLGRATALTGQRSKFWAAGLNGLRQWALIRAAMWPDLDGALLMQPQQRWMFRHSCWRTDAGSAWREIGTAAARKNASFCGPFIAARASALERCLARITTLRIAIISIWSARAAASAADPRHPPTREGCPPTNERAASRGSRFHNLRAFANVAASEEFLLGGNACGHLPLPVRPEVSRGINRRLSHSHLRPCVHLRL